MRTRRAARIFLGLAAPAILASFVSPAPWGEHLFALLAGAFPMALIFLALDRPGRLAWVLLALLVAIEACLAGMLLLRGQALEAPWIAGLPLAAALQLGGLFLLPLLVVPLAYALTFDRSTPKPRA